MKSTLRGSNSLIFSGHAVMAASDATNKEIIKGSGHESHYGKKTPHTQHPNKHLFASKQPISFKSFHSKSQCPLNSSPSSTRNEILKGRCGSQWEKRTYPKTILWSKEPTKSPFKISCLGFLSNVEKTKEAIKKNPLKEKTFSFKKKTLCFWKNYLPQSRPIELPKQSSWKNMSDLFPYSNGHSSASEWHKKQPKRKQNYWIEANYKK